MSKLLHGWFLHIYRTHCTFDDHWDPFMVHHSCFKSHHGWTSCLDGCDCSKSSVSVTTDINAGTIAIVFYVRFDFLFFHGYSRIMQVLSIVK